MTEDEYDGNRSGDDQQQQALDDSQNQDVNAGSPAADDDYHEIDNDFFVENATLDIGDDDQPEEQQTAQDGQQSKQADDIDEHGVPWKNRYMELKRKQEAQQPQQPQYQQPQFQPQQQPKQQGPTFEEQAAEIEARLTKARDAAELGRLTRQLADVQSRVTYEQMNVEQRITQSQNNMVQRISRDYPDAFNPVTPLAIRAEQLLREDYGGDIRLAEAATIRAAQELGVIPKSASQVRRAVTPLPRSRPNAPASEKGSSQPQQKKPALTPRQQAVAKQWGQDPTKVAAMKVRRQY